MSEVFRKQIRRELHGQIPIVKYRTNFTNCILEAFENRQYIKTQGDDWDIIWSEKEFLQELYQRKLAVHQKINHFRNYFQLCRKDQLIKNLKKHKKGLEREGKSSQAGSYSFYPQTYILPNQYIHFADQFKRMQNQQRTNVWIMKPTGKSQGKGIFLFNRLSQVSQWQNHLAEAYIVQKYIADPLLIGGKKFDIRLYALVVSYSPLTVYFYRGGFARFTHCRYDQTNIQNSQIHLTNVAIQKHAQGYDQTIGGKWYIEQLKQYLLSKYGEEPTNQSFFKIQEIVIKTLEALQKVMASQRNNSFQLYGFDVLLDSRLQPWLIEVNGSPSMTANTPKDREFKLGLLDDTLTVLDMEKFLLGNQEQIGGFDLICKGKISKNNQKITQITQRVSFLGTYNNRIQNIKKMAKNYSARLNTQYQKKRDDKKRVMSSNGSNNNTSTNTANSSKKNINGRSLYAPPLLQAKPLSNGSQNSISNNYSMNVAPPRRQFVIKHKLKRQYTNQNQNRL